MVKSVPHRTAVNSNKNLYIYHISIRFYNCQNRTAVKLLVPHRSIRCYHSEPMSKAREKSYMWFLAQEVSSEQARQDSDVEGKAGKKWQPPRSTWMNCNIDFSWSTSLQLGGGAWVLRNSQGVVMLHGRRAFSSCSSQQEAAFVVMQWAVASMSHHRMQKVIFSINDSYVVVVITRPRRWLINTKKIKNKKIKKKINNKYHLKLEDKNTKES